MQEFLGTESAGGILLLAAAVAALVWANVDAGSYDNFEETYAVLGQWIADNGYRVAGPSREIYLTNSDSPSGPVTEIQWPVEKAE